MSSIGERVRQSLDRACPAMPHKAVAALIGMTPDAFSRALNGQRQFGSVELARYSEMAGEDLHWLITGNPDPNRLTIAARHNYDPKTGERTVPSLQDDRQVIDDIALAYRQAYPKPDPAVSDIRPKSPAEVREALGPDFVRPFADRIEECLGIGVVQVKELSTAYSLTIGCRTVIAMQATPSWFRENWGFAHELGHIFLGHHEDEISNPEAALREAAANAFAAELLMPSDQIEAIDWESLTAARLARYIWDWGVSVEALCNRLNSLLGYIPAVVAEWSAFRTQRLLWHHPPAESEFDEIAVRMDDAVQRRFPLSLQGAHLERVASGAISRATLAWMLDVDEAALEVDSPEIPEVSTDDLAAGLGL